MAFSTRAGGRLLEQSVLRRLSLFALATIGVFVTGAGFAQQKSDFVGDYEGALGPIHVKLHIVGSPDGNVTANVDSPQQGLFALPCADLRIDGQVLSFSVPNVRGDWTGVMSPDHKSLSGVWKQANTPMALIFARSAASTSGDTPAVSTPALSATASVHAVAPAMPQPPCAKMLGPSYWDGSAWKPLMMAAHTGRDTGVSIKDGLKNPFNPRAGYTNIVTFKNAEAALTLEPSPRFCVLVPPNYDPTVIMIGSIEVKKDHRELETCAGPCASRGRNSDDWMPQKRVKAVDIKRVSDNTVEITLKSPLQAGQYILGGPPLIGYYDFGVSAGSSAQ